MVGARALFTAFHLKVKAIAALKPGENTVAVRVDHTTITELFLGGILRPVVVVEQ